MKAPPKLQKELNKFAWEKIHEFAKTGFMDDAEIFKLTNKLTLTFGLREIFLKRMSYKEVVEGLKPYKSKSPRDLGLPEERVKLTIKIVEEHLKTRSEKK